MKSIYFSRNQTMGKYVNDFSDTFLEDIKATAKRRNSKFNAVILESLLNKIGGAAFATVLRVKSMKNIDIDLCRVDMEITDHDSINFTIVPLNENKEEVLDPEYYFVLSFMGTQEDLKGKKLFGPIIEIPSERPNSN